MSLDPIKLSRLADSVVKLDAQFNRVFGDADDKQEWARKLLAESRAKGLKVDNRFSAPSTTTTAAGARLEQEYRMLSASQPTSNRTKTGIPIK